ncbi:MAG: GntG family PLP-dependent aldolase [Bacillota bacterium]|nr:GntG family PLP-dependent aldolase [Bacillota bacterium]
MRNPDAAGSRPDAGSFLSFDLPSTAARDFSSDTVTQPDAAMRRAMATAVVGDDVQRTDPTVRELEDRAAALLGKEAALFVASGTMGNQLALLAASEPGSEAILPDSCHIVIHEAAASARLAQVQLRTMAAPLGVPDPDVVESLIRLTPEDIHSPRTAVISYENATSDGAVVEPSRMSELAELARRHGIHVHVDGARFFHAAAALGTDAAELARHADSVMFCLSKGLGAPIGSMLCGRRDFVERARRARKWLGGGWRQAGVIAAAGLLALENRHEAVRDIERAHRTAGQLAALEGCQILPERLAINMIYLQLPAGLDRALLDELTARRLGHYPPERGLWRFVVHRDITDEALTDLVAAVAAALGQAQP